MNYITRPAKLLEEDSPRIYVACLAAYNSGYLHGCWINATQETDEIIDQVNAMLKKSPVGYAEEWAIHDYSGFYGISISESESFEKISELAQKIQEFEDDDYRVNGEVFAQLYQDFGLDEALRMIEEDYIGCYESVSDLAYEQENSNGSLDEIPQHLKGYIDYDAIGRDIELNGEIYVVQLSYRENHYFYNH